MTQHTHIGSIIPLKYVQKQEKLALLFI